MDELGRVAPVPRVGGHAERKRDADRLRRGLGLEALSRDRPADPLGDLERLLVVGLGQEDGELLAAEASRDVVVAELLPKDLGHPRQHLVADKVPVRVVDLAQQVEVGHDQRRRPFEAVRTRQFLAEDTCKVAWVEKAGLRVDASLLLQLRDVQRAVDEEEGREREWDQREVDLPDRGQPDAERGKNELRREHRRREEPRLRRPVPSGEKEHSGHQDVVEGDERDRREESGHGHAWAAAHPVRGVPDHESRHAPGGEPVERVVADVERLDVPGVPMLEPLRDVLDDPHQHDELRRKQQCTGDQEDRRGVVRLIARRANDEQLCRGRTRGEDEERRPVARTDVDPRNQRRRGGERRRGDECEVDQRTARERRPSRCCRLAQPQLTGDGAHLSAAWPVECCVVGELRGRRCRRPGGARPRR